ncbi:unnamed protein product [Parnassius apollo]|uniref:(apollo) hypothetical protein n=1 Tax=Parnassius apollo TaxID=110799 RepID=A0A8S3XHC1_PARAO|nr:unnamed protein product [Parnassius apollo]
MCLTDRFVLGLDSASAREKLFREDPNQLKLNKALEVTCVVESSQRIVSVGDSAELIKSERVLYTDSWRKITASGGTRGGRPRGVGDGGTLSGVLMRGPKIVVPIVYRAAVLQELHAAHLGVVKKKMISGERCWYSGIDSDIEDMASNCGHIFASISYESALGAVVVARLFSKEKKSFRKNPGRWMDGSAEIII